ncbi:hypothetical protein [Glaciimonas immobilis]|uniref:Uncharacterized protein n=1 Tax=Glaciimonas immobilis TaxID=728004 RepID=A0A840RT80_9BURK|nr:hypothetical protein [Glaciimonas immobilis]KAF3996934.1 hypothetical protein HAV38_14700 [Glaciimonas immobilis]MBB5199760.1 hypothetical protein [Glaciimonas immobilis]
MRQRGRLDNSGAEITLKGCAIAAMPVTLEGVLIAYNLLEPTMSVVGLCTWLARLRGD